jgi:hypothetical protein
MNTHTFSESGVRIRFYPASIIRLFTWVQLLFVFESGFSDSIAHWGPDTDVNRHTNSGKFLNIAALILGVVFLVSFKIAQAAELIEVSGEQDVIIKEDFNHNHFENNYFVPDDNGGVDWYQLQSDRFPPDYLKEASVFELKAIPKVASSKSKVSRKKALSKPSKIMSS